MNTSNTPRTDKIEQELQKLRVENESILHDILDYYGRTNPDLRTAARNVMDELNKYRMESSKLEQEIQRLREVEGAAKTLIDKLELIHEDLEYRAVWECAQHNRGIYKGPKYIIEIEDLKSAIGGKEGL